jgi:phosphate transport system substrate-binding protein
MPRHIDEVDPPIQRNENQPSVSIQKHILPAICVIGLGILGYQLIQPCSLGEYKSNFIFCKNYRTFAEVPVNVTGEFKYVGSTALAKLGVELKRKIPTNRKFSVVDVYRDIRLKNKSSNQKIAWSSTAIQELINNRNVAIVFSSRDLMEEERNQAKQKGINLESVPVAKDGLAFFVNQEQKVDSIELDLIKKIYTQNGEKFNWKKDVNPAADDLPIEPFSPDPTDGNGHPEYFQKEILKQPFSGNVQTSGDIPSDVANAVNRTLGGIGFASTSVVCDLAGSNRPLTTGRIKPLQIKDGGTLFPPCEQTSEKNFHPNKIIIQNDKYPLTRKLFIIIKRDNTEHEKAGIAYVNMLLSEEGQKLVDSAGYVPIRELSNSQ